MAYIRYYRAGVRRFRLRANFRRLTLEFSLGLAASKIFRLSTSLVPGLTTPMFKNLGLIPFAFMCA